MTTAGVPRRLLGTIVAGGLTAGVGMQGQRPAADDAAVRRGQCTSRGAGCDSLRPLDAAAAAR